jgi:hypothetical protein
MDGPITLPSNDTPIYRLELNHALHEKNHMGAWSHCSVERGTVEHNHIMTNFHLHHKLWFVCDEFYIHMGFGVLYTRDVLAHVWRQVANYGIAASCESQYTSRTSIKVLSSRDREWFAMHDLLEKETTQIFDKPPRPEMGALHNVTRDHQSESLPQVSLLAARASFASA